MNDVVNVLGEFSKAEPVTKGYSGDKKYYVETIDGRRMLLRISDISELERKKAEYAMMEQAYSLGSVTSQPLGFGVCGEGKSCYSLTEWIDGEDAETVLPRLSEAEQYSLGIKSGELLRKIHTLPAKEMYEDWSVRFGKKVSTWVNKYDSRPEIHSETGKIILRYLKERSGVLVSRTQTFTHGDYNTDNIIVLPSGKIKVIDFNCYNMGCGDPWLDIDNMSWMPVIYPSFHTGQIRGYFDGEPPGEFWDVLSYYLAYDALAALTDPYGLNGIEDGTEIVNNILKWTGHFQNPVPAWYLKSIM